MELQEMDRQKRNAEKNYRATKNYVIFAAIPLFALAVVVAMLLCRSHLKYAEQEMLNEQREVEQAWVGAAVESAQAWYGKLLEQVRHVSQAEIFRLFAVDAQALSPEAREGMLQPEAVDNDDHPLHAMAAERAYLESLLQDTVRRRGWQAALVLDAKGGVLVSPGGGALSEEQMSLIRRAVAEKRTSFGPVRVLGGALHMDMVDPLYQVLSDGEPSIVGFLLISVPVEQALADFLAESKVKDASFSPVFLTGGDSVPQAVRMVDGKPALMETALRPAKDAALPFARRHAASGDGEAWSVGGRLPAPDWHALLEKPARLTDARFKSQTVRTYTLGVLGSLGVALLLGVLGGGAVGRKFKTLYDTISDQKRILDSVNTSLQIGLALVKQGRVTFHNPAFAAIVGDGEGALASVLSTVGEGMTAGRKSVELHLNNGADQTGGERLYRVELFPFSDAEGDAASGDCVAIFKDITEFRRKADEARRRQQECMESLVHGIECALDGEDNKYLQGRSRKLEQLADLLGRQMELSADSRETLRLAARLSQIGKIFVPRELMNSKKKFTDEERKTVQMAPFYAYNVLKSVQFYFDNVPLKVADVVYQMGGNVVVDEATREIRRLGVDEMLPEARILFVANDFCAMVSKRADRADREPLSFADAQKRLAEKPIYAPDVVAALQNIPDEELKRAAETPGPAA